MTNSTATEHDAPKRRRMRRVSLFKRKVRLADLLYLTALLRQLAACHASLPEGVARMAADCPNNQVSMHLNRLSEHMQAGETLSGAMRQSPKFFPRYYVDLVELAGNSDQLETTLAGLIHEVESRLQSGHTVRNRVAYIVIVLSYVVFVSSLLSASAYPTIGDTTKILHGQLHGIPGMGAAVMKYTGFLSKPVSKFTQDAGQLANKMLSGRQSSDGYEDPSIFAVAAPVLFGGAILAALFLTAVLLLLRPCLYVLRHLPGVRRILLYAQWGHALRVLSLLLARGMPLDRALDTAAGSDVQRSVRSALRRLSQQVRSGISLSEALAKEGWRVPGSLRTAAAFGESAGSLGEALERVSYAYRLRAERSMRMLSNLLFPLAIMGCGVLVLAINSRFFGLLSNSIDGILYQL
jgi:type II secretory pathway component PulF